MAGSPHAIAWVERCQMPIFRYFMFVGVALLALLFVADFALPKGPAAQTVATNSEAPLIRIRSDRKLPERVVLDTARPAIASPAVQTAAVVAPQQPANASPALADLSAKAQVRESFAQFAPNAAKTEAARTEGAAVKKAEAKPHRKIARSRPPTPYYYGRPMLIAQQPHFGLFNTTW